MPGAEATQLYQQALKQGQKEYKSCVHGGRWPNIQPLGEDKLKLSQVELGTMEVPLYLVVGSTQETRCNSFSPGFYPLLEMGTEFSAKWIALCEIQLEEGIRDPIKCYEYLGRFYVQEGNKRASVLRSLGAATIQAQVIRLLPEPAEDSTTRIYFEFVEFYRHTGCWGLHFSDLGGYGRLQAALGFGADQDWDEDFRRKFKGCYYRFRECFYRQGGAGLGLTTGDALLRWLRFYSPQKFLSMGDGV